VHAAVKKYDLGQNGNSIKMHLQLHFLIFLQISSLQYPVSAAKGAFVPGRGWYIFGGNSGYPQTQQLQAIDGSWTIGNPLFQPETQYCIVQVIL